MKEFSIEAYRREAMHRQILAEEILSTPGIALVSVGSIACVRSLYYMAREMRKEDWFFGCTVSARDYSLGRQQEAAGRMIGKALEKSGVRAVILYASCMEVLTMQEFEELFHEIPNPEKIPVEVLYRGPLVKRRMFPEAELQRIWKKIGIAPSQTAKSGPCKSENRRKNTGCCTGWEDDFPIPDFEGLVGMLQEADCDILLFSPGGCKSCLDFRAGHRPYQNVYYTRFSDLFLSRGDFDALIEEIRQYFPGDRPLALLGSAVVQSVGLDLEHLAKELTQLGKRTVYLESDGFHSSQEISDRAKTVLQKLRRDPVYRTPFPVRIGKIGSSFGTPDQVILGGDGGGPGAV